MTNFLFRGLDGGNINPQEWLTMWAGRYPAKSYSESKYVELMSQKSLSSAEFEEIGKWKDRAERKWRPNVASVAYPIWMQAAAELPQLPDIRAIVGFLHDWSDRKYVSEQANGAVRKRFGLSRATTLLHFISGGRFPIFDSRVRQAMTRLLGHSVPNSVRWYLDSYCPLFAEVAALCGTNDLRIVDKALFSYGGRELPFSN